MAFLFCNLLQYQIKTFSCACLSWVFVTKLQPKQPNKFDVHFMLINSKLYQWLPPSLHLMFNMVHAIIFMKRSSSILCTEQESNKMSDKTIQGLQLGDIMVTNCQSLDVSFDLLPIILSSDIFFM